MSNCGGITLMMLVKIICPLRFIPFFVPIVTMQSGRDDVWVCGDPAASVFLHILSGCQLAQSVLLRCRGPTQ